MVKWLTTRGQTSQTQINSLERGSIWKQDYSLHWWNSLFWGLKVSPFMGTNSPSRFSIATNDPGIVIVEQTSVILNGADKKQFFSMSMWFYPRVSHNIPKLIWGLLMSLLEISTQQAVISSAWCFHCTRPHIGTTELNSSVAKPRSTNTHLGDTQKRISECLPLQIRTRGSKEDHPEIFILVRISTRPVQWVHILWNIILLKYSLHSTLLIQIQSMPFTLVFQGLTQNDKWLNARWDYQKDYRRIF